MSDLVHRIGKLRGRSFHELKVRGMQQGAIIRDRTGWSDRVRVPSDDAFLRTALGDDAPGRPLRLLEQFQRRTTEHFFGGLEDCAETVHELRVRWPAAEERVLRAADQVCARSFDLLGRKFRFDGPIDWLAEPVMGKRTDLRHWSKVDIHSAEVAGEYKVTWELNRHQHFVTLGKAYLYTGDERFAKEFVAQMESWMAENPPGKGINWASSLELAFRLIAWIWALSLFRSSSTVGPGFFLRVLKFVHLQALHIETYLSTYFSPNTHLTGEALGLFYVGLMFPELRRAALWRKLGSEILVSQVPAHVLPDGVYFERSTFYHRYTADFLIHSWILHTRNGSRLPDEISSGLERLLEHLTCISKPDGTTPLIGDDDGGRLLKLDDRLPDDFRSTLATGSVLLERPDFRFVAREPAEETLWLLGPDGIREFDSLESLPPGSGSRGFFSGGYFVMRDGWTDDANYCIFDCGPHGTMNCGHAHADALAFEMAATGVTLFVDPGSYTYAWPLEDRDYYRGTKAHNTLVIDGVDASVTAGPFGWSHVAETKLGAWLSRPSFDYLSGSHDGYERLDDPVTHHREVLFLKRKYWVIRDTITCKDGHEAALGFHIDPGLKVVHAAHRFELYSDETSRPLASVVTFGPGRFDVRPSGVSPSYGRLVESSVCVYVATLTSQQSLVSFVLPGSAVSSTECIDVEGGEAFRILGEGFQDTLGIGIGSRCMREFGIDTDFRLVWLRRAARDGRLEQFVGIDGSRLEVDGHIAFEAPTAVEYAAGAPGSDRPVDTAVGDQFQVVPQDGRPI